MVTYRAPDVYIEEIPSFPPSVAEVGTAIPAFIGYTEKAVNAAAADLRLRPTKIYSLKEFEDYYGFPKAEEIRVDVETNADGKPIAAGVKSPDVSFLLYYAVKMYFDNGGAQCYIVSVGDYSGGIDKAELLDGLAATGLEDEPTLLVIPEATRLGYADYKDVTGEMLGQCTLLHDRFAILDVWKGSEMDDAQVEAGASAKNVIQANREAWAGALEFGAAYYPFVRTTMNPFVRVDESNVKVSVKPSGGAGGAGSMGAASAASGTGSAGATTGTSGTGGTGGTGGAGGTAAAGRTGGATSTTGKGGASGADGTADELGKLKSSKTAVYNFVKAKLKDQFLVMPPSGAVAGVYAATDAARGVWKAPANVALLGVLEPVVKISTAKQEDLNVDTTAGKSINAIRAFSGKGTLVWGARTLAGNDNEWRYISVRRLFNTVEESVKKSTYWAVFEPNDANTWVKVRGMIENYLIDKWREGALAGATPKDAFFVKCGLGTTMSAQDILEGRMNIEIGMAAVRPAEFLVLKFSHKLQTS